MVASCRPGSSPPGEAPVRARPASPSTDSAASLRAAYVEARQAVGATDARYALQPSGDGLLAAVPGRADRTRVGPEGLSLRQGTQPWQATITAIACGCAGGPAPIDRDAAVDSLPAPNRVERSVVAAGAPLVEWYAHGPLGVDHGFTLTRSPCETGDVAIEERIDGLRAVGLADRRSVSLVDVDGVVRAHYSDLWATDARGGALPVRMEATATGVVLLVDARGAAYPVTVDPLAWYQIGEIVGSLGAVYSGPAARLSGNTAIVGSQTASVNGVQQLGAAYVFVQGSGGWTQQQQLVPTDGTMLELFGTSTALDGDTALIGAPSAPGVGAGAAYVFTRTAGAWTQQQVLTITGGAPNFGTAVALSGTTAIISNGLPGPTPAGLSAAYVFVLQGGTWTQQQVLMSSDEQVSDSFGLSLALSGSTLLVGAPFATVGVNTGQGAAYVFAASGTTFTQQQKLVASDGVGNDAFGGVVALDGSLALVAAPQATVGGVADEGAVYAFGQVGGSFVQEQRIVGTGAGSSATFGRSLALSGSYAMVGSNLTGTLGQGVVLAYTQSGGQWMLTQSLSALDGIPADGFGNALGLDGLQALVVASEVDNQNGAVYFEQLLAVPGTPCTGASACGSGFCVDGTCCDTACSGTCEACDGATPGTCSAIAGAPHGSRPACTSSGPGCGGQCDGMHTDACQYPPTGMSCGTTCTGDQQTDDACDGKGSCVAGKPTTCPDDLTCDPTLGACRSSCTVDGDCVAGATCVGGACQPGVTCIDGHTSQGANGVQDCSPYACAAAAGTCNTSCATVDDCASPDVCDTSGACIPPPDSTSGAGGGCAAAGAGAGGDGAGWLVALGALLQLRTRAVRRRRGRRRPRSTT
jgi:hypothetical protein